MRSERRRACPASTGGRFIRQLALYGAGLAVLSALLVYSVERAATAGRNLSEKLAALLSATAARDSLETSRQPVVARSAVLGEDDDWLRSVKQSFSGGRSSASLPAQKSGLTVAAPAPGFFGSIFGAPVTNDGRPTGSGTYRTVCVRMCDGFYWPISFATSRSSFAQDQKTCESSCASPARLYVYRNPGQEPEDMNGQAYKKLTTAFAYRTTYDQSCKCRPHPWEQEAQDRHRRYALEARRKKGDKQAAQQLEQLKQTDRAQKRADAAAKKPGKSKKQSDVATAEAGGGAAVDDAAKPAVAVAMSSVGLEEVDRSAAARNAIVKMVADKPLSQSQAGSPAPKARKARAAIATSAMRLGADYPNARSAAGSAPTTPSPRRSWTVAVFEAR